jgi:hypothetical protein
MMGHHLIFSALSHNTWTRLSVNSGHDVYSAPISDLEVLQQQVENVLQEIQVQPGIFDRMRASARRRLKVVMKCMGST